MQHPCERFLQDEEYEQVIKWITEKANATCYEQHILGIAHFCSGNLETSATAFQDALKMATSQEEKSAVQNNLGVAMMVCTSI